MNPVFHKKDFFFEAIAYRSHPQTLRLIELLENRNFGKVKKVEANFGFKVKKIRKYRGDPTKVTYRSSWERKFMTYCEENPMILEWSSE